MNNYEQLSTHEFSRKLPTIFSVSSALNSNSVLNGKIAIIQSEVAARKFQSK